MEIIVLHLMFYLGGWWVGAKKVGQKIPSTKNTKYTKKKHLRGVRSRAEWKTQKLEFSKSSSRFWTASQHWFQNNWRNHYRMNILLLNQENSFYRERKLQHSPISSNFLMNGIFVNKVTVSAVTPFRIIWNRSKCSPWGLLGTHRGSRRVHLT